MYRLVNSILFFAFYTLANAQSVGLGTQTPNTSAILDMTSTTKGVLIPRMNTTQRTGINAPAPGLLVYDITTGSFWFRNTNTWVELVDSVNTELHRNGPSTLYMGMTDSVGIGTMSPGQKLQVKTGDENYGISHNSDSVNVATFVSDFSGGWIGTVTNHNFSLYANDGYGQFTLLPNGNIGIATNSPNNRLDVFNGGRSGTHATGRPLYVTGELSDGSNGIEFRHNNGTQGIGFGFNTIYATGSNVVQDLGMASKGNGNLLFRTLETERMRISGAGQVMIGTTTPATGHLLSVGGKIAAEEVLVDLKVDWPDYVFNNNYALPSLSELRLFIADKGHLPGVPSALDVQENGIHLGEMNAVLLEKIEELTLYILAQEERIKRLESQQISNQ
jgi:hypothetical protein